MGVSRSSAKSGLAGKTYKTAHYHGALPPVAKGYDCKGLELTRAVARLTYKLITIPLAYGHVVITN